MIANELLKASLDALVAAVVDAANIKGLDVRQLYGIAEYDTSKDSFIVSSSAFALAEEHLQEFDLAIERYGAKTARRLALQFVYEYFARCDGIALIPDVLDQVWRDFVAESETPHWLTRTVTNLRNFRCEQFPVMLGDGLSIQMRDPAVLAELGFPSGLWPHLIDDWSGWGQSPFVLVAEGTNPKCPENVVALDTMGTMLRCMRAIGAMRLVGDGDVGMSKMFVQRVARFNVGIGGIRSSGRTPDIPGTDYAWSAAHLPAYKETYTALARLEATGYTRAPGNLDLALRSFMSSYDRSQGSADERLLDTTTALEAALGSETEIAFKLAFRIASLLAAGDDERSDMLNAVKQFYDARSRIVHGGRLSKKHAASLASVDDLRGMARRLLRAFVRLASDETRDVGKATFAGELDAQLVNGRRRDELRRLLGLVE